MPSDGAEPSTVAQDPQPVAYINECPACGKQFLGMSIVEWRDSHAAKSCPQAPLTVAQLVEAERHYSYGGAHGQ